MTKVRSHPFKGGATDYPYEHRDIELRRQRLWAGDDRFRVQVVRDEYHGKWRGPNQRYRYIKPSAPFTSGNIHMGHVRSYTIGDAYARFCRARGDEVLLAFGFDAFGLPAEMAADREQTDPDRYVHGCATHMSTQLRRLGYSFDWRRSFVSSDHEMYRWSQWLFLTLLEAGLIYNTTQFVTWCNHCETTLANMQVEPHPGGGGACWRCHERVTKVKREVWMLKISDYLQENSVENITGDWDEVAIRSQEAVAEYADDWPISRERTWGTPVPAIKCKQCGWLPMPKHWLPWKRSERKVTFICPSCGESEAVPDYRTLDCHFDALWLWIAPTLAFPWNELTSVEMSFQSTELHRWLPADRIVAGSDSGGYMFNQRIVTKMLRDLGYLDIDDGEPFVNATLHEMVRSNGQKMSKHLGNVVDPDELVTSYGADTIRLAVLYAAKASKPLDWTEEAVEYCHAFLKGLWRYVNAWKAASTGHDHADVTAPERRRLEKWTAAAVRNVTADMVKLDMHKAVRGIIRFYGLIHNFEDAARKKRGAIYDADRAALLEALDVLLRLLAPFSPHIAEELYGTTEPDAMAWPTNEEPT